MTGSVAEFVLTPIFHHYHHYHHQPRQPSSSRRPVTTFACHVQPLAGYALYHVQFSVAHRDDVIGDVTTSRRLVTPNDPHPYRTVDKYV